MHKSAPPPSQRPAADPSTAASCPVALPNQTSTSSPKTPSYALKLNPLNYMPSLSQDRAADQKIKLPTSRENSSIPRGDAQGNWVYPSPQQMYNAMLRKGYDDTPEDAVETMVAVHNFLNEGAWQQIEGWEKRFGRGLVEGWKVVSGGEEEAEKSIAKEAESGPRWGKGEEPKLVRFMGRPGDMTPKARIWDLLGKAWPAKFATEPPFDRHDWFVQRTMPDGKRLEVRYVIDYYSGPPEPTGEPVFYLDVRPAVDGPTAACERMMRWGGDVWYKASGANSRQGAS